MEEIINLEYKYSKKKLNCKIKPVTHTKLPVINMADFRTI